MEPRGPAGLPSALLHAHAQHLGKDDEDEAELGEIQGVPPRELLCDLGGAGLSSGGLLLRAVRRELLGLARLDAVANLGVRCECCEPLGHGHLAPPDAASSCQGIISVPEGAAIDQALRELRGSATSEHVLHLQLLHDAQGRVGMRQRERE